MRRSSIAFWGCLLLSFTLPRVAASQGSPAWKADLGGSIYYMPLSEDGRTLMIQTKKGITCYDVASGAVRWTRPIEHFVQGFSGRFVGKNSFVFGNEDHFEIVDVSNGSVQKTLPIIGESWRALRWDVQAKPDLDTMQPHFWGDLGVFYWGDGFQLIDFNKGVVVHSAPHAIRAVKYETFGDYAMIWSRSGIDTAYIIDLKTSTVAYQYYTGSNDLNGSIYQHFVVHKGQLLLFTEKNIISVDLATQHVNAILPVDPDDPDVYLPVLAEDRTYLLTSDKDIQTLYDGQSGALLWQSKAGAIPGVAEEFTPLEDGSFGLLMAYQKDGKIAAHKVNIKTGAIAWSRVLAEQDGSYSPGHHRSSSTLAVLGAVALQVAAAAANRGMSRAGSYNSRSGWGASPMSSRPSTTGINWQAVANSTNRKQESEGFISVLDLSHGTATFLCGGKLWTELSKSSHDTYDGEGVIQLSLTDGSVLKHLPASIAGNASGKLNAAKDIRHEEFGEATVIVGTHDLHVLRNGTLESFAFGKDKITYIGSDEHQLEFVCDHDGDYWDYWSVDPTVTPAKRTLLARSLKNNFVFAGAATFGWTLYYDKDALQAFPLMTGAAAEKPDLKAPAWQLSEKELDKLDVGNLSKNRTNSDALQGIRVDGSTVYLMGSDRIGKAVINDQCRWSVKWDVDEERQVLGLTTIGKGLIYDCGSSCGVIANDCVGSELGKHKIGYAYAKVLTTPEDRVIVLNRDDGLIFCYDLK